MNRLQIAITEAGNWIAKATKNKGSLKRAFPGMAKKGFSNKELDRIMKTGTSKQKKAARLAKTLKTFHK